MVGKSSLSCDSALDLVREVPLDNFQERYLVLWTEELNDAPGISEFEQQLWGQELARKLPRRFADGFWKNEAGLHF